MKDVKCATITLIGLFKKLFDTMTRRMPVVIKRFLDDGVANNWTNDRYNWSREIVAVTGGSDGIGAKIVQMLASKGIKTVILDIQEPKFVRECMPYSPHLRYNTTATRD